MDKRKMYHAFFIKNLATFLIPMMIPVFILGSLTTIIIHQYVKEEINTNNINLLKHSEEKIRLFFDEQVLMNIHLVAREMDVSLKNVFQKEQVTPEDQERLSSLYKLLHSPAIARSYIDSIYIYLKNDKQRIFTSADDHLVELQEFYDRTWFETFLESNRSKALVWSEPRTVMRYEMENRVTSSKFISVYKKLSISDNDDGVIVFNIKHDYIEYYLSGFPLLKDQSLLIVDKNQEVIFRKNVRDYVNLDIRELMASHSSFFPLKIGDESYIVSMLSSEKYGWRFYSIVPEYLLYELPRQLSYLALAMLILSLLGGTALAYQLSKKNRQNIKTMLHLFHAAEKGLPLPPLPEKGKDVYGFIIQIMLKNFIEQNYLKIQLSEQKYKAQAMELSALQSQLNPHFLFNTLETIYWKAASLTGRPNVLNQMVENLADILRYSLEGESKWVKLQEEVTYTLSYIEIQKVRYKDTFDVIWELDESISEIRVLKLILQPLIENSLYHGIKEKQSYGMIKVKIRALPDALMIQVIDNGVGIDKDKLLAIREQLDAASEQTKHIGLFNTHRRLKLTFGDEYGLRIKSKAGWGSVVAVRIPFKREESRVTKHDRVKTSSISG